MDCSTWISFTYHTTTVIWAAVRTIVTTALQMATLASSTSTHVWWGGSNYEGTSFLEKPKTNSNTDNHCCCLIVPESLRDVVMDSKWPKFDIYRGFVQDRKSFLITMFNSIIDMSLHSKKKILIYSVINKSLIFRLLDGKVKSTANIWWKISYYHIGKVIT